MPPLNKGHAVNDSGYPRISTGPLRHKYLHRDLVETLLAETHPLTLQVAFGIRRPPIHYRRIKLPEGFQVHHIDYDKLHCCACNLLLIQSRIHRAISNYGQDRAADGTWKEIGNDEPPDWVLSENEDLI